MAGNGSVWNSVKRWLPGVIISVTALAIVLHLSNWSDLQLAFSGIRPASILLATLVLIISLGFRAQAWRTLLRKKATLWQTYKVMNVGYLLNNLFPLRAGEIGRAIFLGQMTRLGTFHVLSSIVLERSFDLIYAAIVLLITLPLALGLDWAKPVAISTLVLVILLLTCLYLIAKYRQKVSAWIKVIGRRWSLVERYVLPSVDSLLNGLGVLTDVRQFAMSALWMMLAWLTAIITDYILLLPFLPQSEFWWAGFVIGVVSVGVAVPSAPAALGVYEASVVAALTLLGASSSSALAYGILLHFFSFAVTGIFGLFGLAQEGKSISTMMSEIRIKQPDVTVPADVSQQE